MTFIIQWKSFVKGGPVLYLDRTLYPPPCNNYIKHNAHHEIHAAHVSILMAVVDCFNNYLRYYVQLVDNILQKIKEYKDRYKWSIA